jgi:uncharacterized protein YndB with AHSA1/START domain
LRRGTGYAVAMVVYALSITLGVALVVTAIGLFLPARFTVEHSTVIDQPVEKIFPWVAELKLWPQWTVWNTAEDATLRYLYPGATTGLAGSMHWTAKKMGAGSLIFSAFEPNQALRYEMRMPAHGTIVYGNIEFESAGSGTTRVSWYDEIDLGRNPFKKLLGPMVRKMLGRAFARSLAGLKAAAMTDRASGPGPG